MLAKIGRSLAMMFGMKALMKSDFMGENGMMYFMGGQILASQLLGIKGLGAMAVGLLATQIGPNLLERLGKETEDVQSHIADAGANLGQRADLTPEPVF